jgi:hypothetical protein
MRHPEINSGHVAALAGQNETALAGPNADSLQPIRYFTSQNPAAARPAGLATHSSRRMTMGSTRAARTAGTRQDNAAAAINTSAARDEPVRV